MSLGTTEAWLPFQTQLDLGRQSVQTWRLAHMAPGLSSEMIYFPMPINKQFACDLGIFPAAGSDSTHAGWAGPCPFPSIGRRQEVTGDFCLAGYSDLDFQLLSLCQLSEARQMET